MPTTAVRELDRPMHLWLTEELQARLKRQSRKRGEPMAQVVRTGAIMYLNFLEEEELQNQKQKAENAAKMAPRSVGLGIDLNRSTAPAPSAPATRKPEPDNIKRLAQRIANATGAEREQLLDGAVEAIAMFASSKEDAEEIARTLDDLVKKATPSRGVVPNGLDLKF